MAFEFDDIVFAGNNFLVRANDDYLLFVRIVLCLCMLSSKDMEGRALLLIKKINVPVS